MAGVEVGQAVQNADGYAADVEVHEANRIYQLVITVSFDDYEHWGAGFTTPEDFIKRCTEMLVERVSVDELMERIDIREARQFYPAFEDEMTRVFE